MHGKDLHDYLNNRWLRPIGRCVWGEHNRRHDVLRANRRRHVLFHGENDVNALDVNEMVWDPSLVRCDNLHEVGGLTSPVDR